MGIKEKVACYVRVSTSSQTKKDKYSIPEQRDILINICNRNEWQYIFYEDLGITGEAIEIRPKFKELLGNCVRGIYKKVLVTDQDRLTRNISDLQYIKDIFIENNINLVIGGDILDLSNEDIDFRTDIDGVFSKRERRIIAKRSARGKYQKAKQGKIPASGNNIPYGYCLNKNDEIVINEDEAKIVKKIFNWIANRGYSGYKIAEKLNKLGIPTRSKNLGRVIRSIKDKKKFYKAQWTRSVVSHIVGKELYYQNKYIYGKSSKYNFVEPTPIKKEPIISKRLFTKAREQMSKNKSYHGYKKETTIYILTGKMKCIKCGGAYCGGRWLSKKHKFVYYYRDAGKINRNKDYGKDCNGASIKKDFIENIIKNDIKKYLLNPDTIKIYLEKEAEDSLKDDFKINELKNEIEKKNQEINKLLDLYSKSELPGGINESNFGRVMHGKAGEIEELKGNLFEVENKKEVLKDKKDKLNKLSIILKEINKGIDNLNDWEWKRIIDKLIEKIEIDSIGKRGKTEKLDIYINYNFDKLVEKKSCQCANYIYSRTSDNLNNLFFKKKIKVI